MASTSQPIVVHYQDAAGVSCTLLIDDSEESDHMEVRTGSPPTWLRVPVSELGELDGWEVLHELNAVARVMHATTPTQDAEGRWVYGEAPKGGE